MPDGDSDAAVTISPDELRAGDLILRVEDPALGVNDELCTVESVEREGPVYLVKVVIWKTRAIDHSAQVTVRREEGSDA